MPARSRLTPVDSNIRCLGRWARRHDDVVELLLADGSQGECEDTDGEAHDRDASDGVLEEIRSAGADESCRLSVVGFVVGGAFEEGVQRWGSPHVAEWLSGRRCEWVAETSGRVDAVVYS